MTNQPPASDRATGAEDLEPGTMQHAPSPDVEWVPGDQRAAETLVVEPRAARDQEAARRERSTMPEEPDPMTDDSQRPVILSPLDGTVLSGRDVTFAGTTVPESNLVFRDWLRPVAECEADAEGRWTATVRDLASGVHVFVAEWVDSDGALRATSAAWTVHVPTQKELDAIATRQQRSGRRGIRGLLRRRSAPSGTPDSAPIDVPQPATSQPKAEDAAPAPDELESATSSPPELDSSPSSPPDPDAPRIVYPEEGGHVGQTLTLFGSSSANCTIAVLDDSDLVGLTESDDTGYWTATVKGLTPGLHQMKIRSSVDGSEWRRISPPVTVVVHERISPDDVNHP